MSAPPAQPAPERELERDSGRPYVLAWLALLVLTGLSFGAHYLELGAWTTTVALAFASAKALIVALVFMHLRQESISVRTVAALNVAWVALICGGIALDVASH